MSIRYYSCGFYENQEVVATGNSEAHWIEGIPPAGTKGRFEYQEVNGPDCLISWNCGDSNRRVWVNPTRALRYGCTIKAIVPEPKRNESGKRICACCGEEIDDDKEMMFTPYENDWICIDCRDDNYSLCSECNQWHPIDDMYSVYTERNDTRSVCNACLQDESLFFFCENCNEWYDRRYHRSHYVSDFGNVCDECASSAFATCDECGEYFNEDSLEYDDGSYYCSNCMRRRHRESIRSYSYKPIPKFKLKHKSDQFESDASISELLMGAELEVDKGHDPYICADKIQKAVEDVYCKRDGSLGDYGIEIVSHPCSLNYHMNVLGWDKIIQICREYGYTSHEAKTCGLHIHVGRRQLEMGDANSDSVAAKVVLCVYRHWDRIVKFSRRTEGQLHWCDKNDIDFSECYDESGLLDAALETREAGRYQAVNLCNDNTVEFRIFRGSLELRTILSAFQLVSNICHYCQKHTGFEVMNSQWEDVAYYADYPELSEYLVSRELAQTSLLDQLPAWEFPHQPVRIDVVTDDMIAPPNPWADENYINLRDDSGFYRNSNNRLSDFNRGDYVVVVNTATYDGGAGIALIGRVAVVDIVERRLGIVFNTGSFRHSLQGLLNDTVGYWMRPYHLARLESQRHPEIQIPLRHLNTDVNADATTVCAPTMTYTIDATAF